MHKKNKIVIIASSLIALSGGAFYWNNGDTDKASGSQTKTLYITQQRDSLENSMRYSIDEITNRLDSVRRARGFISIYNAENLGDKKQQALQNIFILNNALISNQYKIEQLQRLLAESRSTNEALRRRLYAASQNNKITYSDVEELREELSRANDLLYSEKDITKRLEQRVQDQEKRYQRLNQQFIKADQEAYTAYYITGTRQQLNTLKVIDPRSGPVTVSSEIPAKEFEAIDARDEAIIPTHAKDPVLVTRHAKDSYVWQDDEDGMKNLYIIDPGKFWQTSKYLVVQTK